jgi:hypothetical protein
MSNVDNGGRGRQGLAAQLAARQAVQQLHLGPCVTVAALAVSREAPGDFGRAAPWAAIDVTI